MSTIWEMAAIIRNEEAHALRPVPIRGSNPGVDINGPDRIAFWCKYFGTTPLNLCCAIEAVGSEPKAVRQFLRSRGRPALA